LSEYNKPPVVNPIPTAILAILSGIVLVEVFLFFGFSGLVGNSGVVADKVISHKKLRCASWSCKLDVWGQV